jgi:hypothetical protein
MRIDHMMLLLQRSPEQENALEQFINQLHDPKSPLFHHWITAAELGQKFGVTPAELVAVTDWLQSQGFEVNVVYRNGILIDFSGNAGQIREAFHTEIHHLVVNGQAHIANMSDPQIPAALAATVAGIVSLNDFRPHPMFKRRSTSAPAFTTSEGDYLLVPADLATIYNFSPAFKAGISGQGQTIVLIEDSDLYTTDDWTKFRSTFGLTSAYPSGSLAQVHPASTPTNNCTDPGPSSATGEETLDVEWASAGAPNAAMELASCSDTTTNFGGFIALQNILNASGTPPAVVSISYGEGEPLVGAAFNLYIKNLYMQAVTAGVSVFVASGDSGADVSEQGSPYATVGINVSAFTSTPYNVSVGGTDFADTYENVNSSYWSSTNSSTYGSALSYIPEIPWNDSCASVLTGDYAGILPTYGSDGFCNNSSAIAFGYLVTAGGSGGPSGCATGEPNLPYVVGGTCAGYAKPSWQAGFVGIQSDGVRDIPDVALFASDGSAWGHYYVYCFSDLSQGGASCSGTPDTWAGAGGTSFASPIMASIQALANQASSSRWGNPNPMYYSLAAAEYGADGSTSCNSALGNRVGSDCIFYDVTQIPLLYTDVGAMGGDNNIPCTGMNCYLPSGTYGVLSTAPQKLGSVSVTNLGSGYTSAPSCTLSGGGGSGATCSAKVTGVVSAFTLTNGGSGYDGSPTCTLTGGGGTGATCELIDGDNAVLSGAFLTNFGSGYTSTPTCAITGGGGAGATCTATETTGIAVSLTAAGSGYTKPPSCVLSGGGGTGATCATVPKLNSSDAYQPAFESTKGWDFTSGIGTVNAWNLVSSFATSPALSVTPTSLTFATTTVDVKTAAKIVTVKNTGKVAVLIAAAGISISGTNSSSFGSSTTCPVSSSSTSSLAAGASCTISVSFDPTTTGKLTATLEVADNNISSPQEVTLTGTGTDVSLSPAALAFGTVTTSKTLSVTVKNIGTATLDFSKAPTITGTGAAKFAVLPYSATGPVSTCLNGTVTLAQDATCTYGVEFTNAVDTTAFTASLNIFDNAAGSPQLLPLTGNGTEVTLTPATLAFGTVSTNETLSVTVKNVGTTTLDFSKAPTVTGTGAANFVVLPYSATGPVSTCLNGTVTLPQNATCTYSVEFTNAGGTTAFTTHLNIFDNGGGSPQLVTMTATD